MHRLPPLLGRHRMPLCLVAALMLAMPGFSETEAEDVTLLAEGKSAYQIVLPDAAPTPALGESLQQTARLLGTAFAANGAEVPVVGENQRDPDRPAIYLGATKFAAAQGVRVETLRGWSYVQRAVGRDILLAGHDHAARAVTENARRPGWDRVGTAKAVVDFAREFMGVRFLYPDIASYQPVAAAAKVDLLASPAIEYLPMKTMTVPADLKVEKTPLLRVNTAHPAGGGFYDLAHNRFPRVDELFGGHTWERAVPGEKYWEAHPEYFALINGERLKPEGGRAQYCLSNPAVQELIYQDLVKGVEQGHEAVDLGQPDGFRPCQCEDCEKLHGTGKDWGEKIWSFNRQVAERLEKSHPGRQVTMMSYIQTAAPPRGFTGFPANTCVMLTGTNEEDIAPWRSLTVPRGFTGYVYNWCPNLGTRYTPMRTPMFIEAQARRLAANRIQSLYRDGPGQLFGLEGPVYYVMGRMFDDPEKNRAKDLLPEFCEAAFGDKSTAFYMRSFYDQLYQAIALYSDHIGTRNDAWTTPTVEGGRRKSVQDPFQLITFLYPPRLLTTLETDLAMAEKQSRTSKAKTRLALVRTEFEYLRHLARVAHLHQAYSVLPAPDSLGRLLDAIDARNAHLATLFDNRGGGKNAGGWAYPLFPFPGHDIKHLRLSHDGYQEPYANTCYNWDTKAMRAAPQPGRKRVLVSLATGPVTLDAPQWKDLPAQDLTWVPPLHKLPRQARVQLLYDERHLYIRAECELSPDLPAAFPALARDRSLAGQEAFEVYLAPSPAGGEAFRLGVGANAASRYDAVAGRIADVMDPRHGKDDPTWNGEWTAESRVDPASLRWEALLAVPFATLETTKPEPGTAWKGNFARHHKLLRDQMDRAVWSTEIGNASLDDRSLFGEIVFE